MSDDSSYNPADEIPEYDPEMMTIHTCRDCGRHEPVANRFAGTPLCHFCGGLLERDEEADRYARVNGFKVSR